MKKVIALASVLCLVSLAPASARRSSTESAPYVAGGSTEVGPDGSIGMNLFDVVGGVSFEPGDATLVSIEIEDASTGPVLATLTQNQHVVKKFCGSTARPVKIAPGAEIGIFLFNGPCPDGARSVVTTGTINATFSR